MLPVPAAAKVNDGACARHGRSIIYVRSSTNKYIVKIRIASTLFGVGELHWLIDNYGLELEHHPVLQQDHVKLSLFCTLACAFSSLLFGTLHCSNEQTHNERNAAFSSL